MSDLTVTLDAFRLGQWVGNYIFDVDADQARVPITLPQPLFSVRRSFSVLCGHECTVNSLAWRVVRATSCAAWLAEGTCY